MQEWVKKFMDIRGYLPYLLITFGGFSGAALRYFIDSFVVTLEGTLLVNTIGCFFLGVFMYESIYFGMFSRNTRFFFAVGVIGSFTTFSALTAQTFQAGPVIGLLNLAANFVFGLIGIFGGRHFILYQRGI